MNPISYSLSLNAHAKQGASPLALIAAIPLFWPANIIPQ
jgi:hypothetical protein